MENEPSLISKAHTASDFRQVDHTSKEREASKNSRDILGGNLAPNMTQFKSIIIFLLGTGLLL